MNFDWMDGVWVKIRKVEDRTKSIMPSGGYISLSRHLRRRNHKSLDNTIHLTLCDATDDALKLYRENTCTH